MERFCYSHPYPHLINTINRGGENPEMYPPKLNPGPGVESQALLAKGFGPVDSKEYFQRWTYYSAINCSYSIGAKVGYYAFTYSMGLWVSEQKAELECNGVDTPQTVMTTRAPAVLRNMEDPLAKC